MQRKKWTAKAEITEDLLKSREKRRWQLALRRYILEKNMSANYAFYFGLDIEQFRKWIEIQFTGELNWDNFGGAWQLDHILPVGYFDFSQEEDLKLCWNFINTRVQKLEPNKNEKNQVDIIAVASYFQELYEKTGFSVCKKMIEKIRVIISANLAVEPVVEDFILKNKDSLEIISTLSKEEFTGLNIGMSLGDIFLERKIINKFG